MERVSNRAYAHGSPQREIGLTKTIDVTQRESMPASLHPKASADLIKVNVKAHNRPKKIGIQHGKNNLGIDYDILDSHVTIEPSPSKALAQSIDVAKKTNRISLGAGS